MKDYYTYTWAAVPEGRSKAANLNCCAVFQGTKVFSIRQNKIKYYIVAYYQFCKVTLFFAYLFCYLVSFLVNICRYLIKHQFYFDR